MRQNIIRFFVVISILLALEIPPSAEGPGPNGDVAVTLKLDVLALDNKLNVSNDFNRTDDITICYRLTNTMGSQGQTAKEIVIATNISNILVLPKKTVKVSSNKNHDNDGEGFYLECRIDSGWRFWKKKCKIENVIIDKNGNMYVKSKYLHPIQTEIIYINYSTKISKNAPSGDNIKCSGIKDEDVEFNRYVFGRNPLDLSISQISIRNNKPLMDYDIIPIEKYIIQKHTFTDNLTYILTRDSYLEIYCELFDVENSSENLTLKLYDKIYDTDEIIATEIPINNGKFRLDTPGNHKLEVEVYDGETYHSEIWRNTIIIENITLDEHLLNEAIKTHNGKNSIILFIVSLIMCTIFIFIPYCPRKQINQKLMSIILWIAPIISLMLIFLLYFFVEEIHFKYIYIYEILIYLLSLTISIILIEYKIRQNVVVYTYLGWCSAGIVSILFILLFHRMLPDMLKNYATMLYVSSAILNILFFAFMKQFPIDKTDNISNRYIISFILTLGLGAILYTALYTYNIHYVPSINLYFKFEELLAAFFVEFGLLFILLCSPVMPYLIYDLLNFFSKEKKKESAEKKEERK